MSLFRTTATLAASLLPFAASAFTPEGGFYSVPSQPGTGLAVEISNQFLFAAGYVYDTAGRPTFATVQGPLTKSTDGWLINGSLFTSTNGQCIGTTATCPYKLPTTAATGTARLEFISENIVTIRWGAANAQQELNMFRFGFGSASEVESLLGEWDVLIDQATSSNRSLYSGEKLQFNTATTANNLIVGLQGCVPTSELSPACSSTRPVTLTFAASGGGFGNNYVVSARDSANLIIRRYEFSSNGLGGQFTQTFKGNVTVCNNSTTVPASCTGSSFRFAAYRSASRQYGQTGSGMD